MDKWPTFTTRKYLTTEKIFTTTTKTFWPLDHHFDPLDHYFDPLDHYFDPLDHYFDPLDHYYSLSGLSGEDRGKPPSGESGPAKHKPELDKSEDFRQF